MSFWNSEKLKKRCFHEKLISSYKESRVKHAAYELSLGNEYFSTEAGNRTKKTIGYKEQISIAPGQFALLLTEEKIRIPNDSIGLISIKAGIKFKGLINVSGFHVDPGYEGPLVFSVFNAGSQPIPLTREKPIFLLWFCELTDDTKDIYDGKNNGNGITDRHVADIQGTVASPAELYSRLTELEKTVRVYRGAVLLALPIIFTLFAAIISGMLPKLLGQ